MSKRRSHYVEADAAAFAPGVMCFALCTALPTVLGEFLVFGRLTSDLPCQWVMLVMLVVLVTFFCEGREIPGLSLKPMLDQSFILGPINHQKCVLASQLESDKARANWVADFSKA
ncbi:hypothetical protein [Marinobacter adhaerens]|uniref:hypothetical protein n=1 Tax=Marinobacter adhaerens TaxID=1033846 RepID=UPI003D121855